MIDSDESFDVTTPWNTNHDKSIDIVPSEKQPPGGEDESDQSNKEKQLEVLATKIISVLKV